MWVCVDAWVMSATNVYTVRKSRSFIQFLVFKFLALPTVEARELISPFPSFSIKHKVEDNY